MTQQDRVRRRRAEPDGWTHQVADLRSGALVTAQRERPFTVSGRAVAVQSVLEDAADLATLLSVPERVLTPRYPYRSAPVSFLLAYNTGWSLLADDDELQWVADLAPDGTAAEIDAWFKDVTPGTTAVVTLTLSVAVAASADEGRYDVFATGADPVQFPVHGFREHTVDVVVRPSSATVIVSLLPVSGIDLLEFREISYSTIS